jgi:hypothetical protein
MKTYLFSAATLAASLTCGAATAAAQDARAMEILGKTRRALGGEPLDAMKTFSLQAAAQRNIGERQMASEVELFLEMPDKYMKSEVSRGMMNVTMNTGFNGDRAILPAHASMAPGGAMIIRMGPGGPAPAEGPKLTDEQKAEVNRRSVRVARVELSRLMLGWFGAVHPALDARFTYAGEAESPDGKAHVIDVTDAAGFEARLFVDQTSYLPLMVAYKARAPHLVTSTGRGNPQGRELTGEERRTLGQDTEERVKRELAEQPLVDFSLFFDEWREVDGINFPHVMRRASGGETTEEWTVSKVRVNPKIDPEKFAVDGR